MPANIGFQAIIQWILDNQEWLFQGVGLSAVLFTMGLLWKGCLFLGQCCRTWGEGFFDSAIDRLSGRGAKGTAGKTPTFQHKSSLIRPSEEEIRRHEEVIRQHELLMMGRRSGRGDYGYLGKGRPSDTMISSHRGPVASASYIPSKPSKVARILFLAAIANLIWVAVSAFM